MATAKKTAKKPVKPKKPHGRPSLYTVALGQKICERLSKGEPLAQICRDEGMPSDGTVRVWMDKNPAFSNEIAQARARGYDVIAADCLAIADDARNDFMDGLAAFGDDAAMQAKLNGEHIQRSKLRIETRLKLLAKWDPKRYGEKLELSGDQQNPLIHRIERVVKA